VNATRTDPETADTGARRPVDVDEATRELLAALLDPAGPAPAHGLPTGTGANGEVPLTEGQRQLWFLQQLRPESTAYNVCTALRLRGALRADALGAALNDLLARHDALRTNILTGPRGRPRAVVRPAGPAGQCALTDLTDLAGRADEDRDARIERLALADLAVPFDLADGPLCRARLVRLAADDHALILIFHHAVVDGWSMRVLLRDLAALYRGRSGGAHQAGPDPRHQYADFAAWQNTTMKESPQYERSIAHWRRTLRDAPAQSTAPPDHPRTADGTRTGRSVHFDLPVETVRDLVALAAAQATTPFAVTFTAFALWLARASQSTDVVIGVPSAGRPFGELDDTVGYFMNLLPLRVGPSPERSFADAVRAVHATVAAGLDHDLPPFDRIVKSLGLGRVPGVPPLVQVMFQLVDDRTVGGETRDWPGLDVEECRIRHDDAARFDLELVLRHDGRDAIQGCLTYDDSLYRPQTAEQAREDYSRLVAALCRTPNQPIGPLLDGSRS
jgi:Condensation domain